MKKSIAMKWVKALRSGKYAQGEAGVLQDGEGGYCCLGVLCDLADKAGVEDAFDGYYLPDVTVIEWAGLKAESPFLKYKDRRVDLAGLNDGECLNIKRRATFAELADLIESEWENL